LRIYEVSPTCGRDGGHKSDFVSEQGCLETA
jgi:hypothetical protein